MAGNNQKKGGSRAAGGAVATPAQAPSQADRQWVDAVLSTAAKGGDKAWGFNTINPTVRMKPGGLGVRFATRLVAKAGANRESRMIARYMLNSERLFRSMDGVRARAARGGGYISNREVKKLSGGRNLQQLDNAARTQQRAGAFIQGQRKKAAIPQNNVRRADVTPRNRKYRLPEGGRLRNLPGFARYNQNRRRMVRIGVQSNIRPFKRRST